MSESTIFNFRIWIVHEKVSDWIRIKKFLYPYTTATNPTVSRSVPWKIKICTISAYLCASCWKISYIIVQLGQAWWFSSREEKRQLQR